MALIGLDIGGTKLLVAAADRSGRITRMAQAATPAELPAGLQALQAMVREVSAGESIEGLGAACGGPLDAQNGIVSPLHQPEWRKVPLREIFQRAFQCPFQVEVDTDAAAMAEYRFGPEQPARLLYLTLSTGVGGGFLVEGGIFRGANGIHPEVGHQAAPYRLRNGALAACACGSQGCLEALVSGTNLRRIYRKPAEGLDETEWAEVGYNLGMGLRNLAAIYVPDVIVLGGGVVVGSGARFLPAAESTMRDGLRLVPAPRLRVSALGYHTALLGAIALAQIAAKTQSRGATAWSA